MGVFNKLKNHLKSAFNEHLALHREMKALEAANDIETVGEILENAGTRAPKLGAAARDKAIKIGVRELGLLESYRDLHSLKFRLKKACEWSAVPPLKYRSMAYSQLRMAKQQLTEFVNDAWPRLSAENSICASAISSDALSYMHEAKEKNHIYAYKEYRHILNQTVNPAIEQLETRIVTHMSAKIPNVAAHLWPDSTVSEQKVNGARPSRS